MLRTCRIRQERKAPAPYTLLRLNLHLSPFDNDKGNHCNQEKHQQGPGHAAEGVYDRAVDFKPPILSRQFGPGKVLRLGADELLQFVDFDAGRDPDDV